MILEAKSFIDIIFDIIGTYFNFDICYPKQLLSILFFFQYYIFHIDKIQPNKFPESLTNFINLVNSLN